MGLYEKLISKRRAISVIGLGYVGLNLAVELAKVYRVVGFDQDKNRVLWLKESELWLSELGQKRTDLDLSFSHKPDILAQADLHLIAVPTPVDKNKQPDLSYILKACKTVGRYLRSGQVVVIESTVYPGFTEQECVPVLEEVSGLTHGKDFFVGYSPERINPGDREHKLSDIVKVVAGSTPQVAQELERIYSKIIKAGTYVAPDIKTAEAAKILENIQRDVNIALMNQVSRIFQQMGISSQQVIRAAATKWNFLPFRPGLVGGWCIGTDTYYLIHKVRELDYEPMLLLAARAENETFAQFLAQKILVLANKAGFLPQKTKLLMLGFAYKPDVGDIKNTKIAQLVYLLKDFGFDVDIYDPMVSRAEAEQLYPELSFVEKPMLGAYHLVIIAVQHEVFQEFTENWFAQFVATDRAVVADLTGFFIDKFSKLNYWTL